MCSSLQTKARVFMKNLLSVAKILNFHGIQGEAKVGFSKGKEEQIKALKKVFVEEGELNISSVRFHKGFAIIKFEEINSIDELLKYKGENLFVEKEVVKKQLEEEEYLISDLVGLKAFDDKEDFIGIVKSVGTNTGTDLLVIQTEDPQKPEVLIPFVKELVPIVDLCKGEIIIKPIEGLL